MYTNKKELQKNISTLIKNGYTPKRITVTTPGGYLNTKYIKRAIRFIRQIPKNQEDKILTKIKI